MTVDSLEKKSDMDGGDFPEELHDVVKNFHGSVSDLQTQLRLMTSESRLELHERLDPMGRATMDLMSAYALNSLYWMLLKTMGVNPAESEVKTELGRVQEAMKRLKEVKDREKRGRLDQGAAKRLVTSGLWEPGQPKIGAVKTASNNTSSSSDLCVDYAPPRKKIKQFDV